MQKTKEKDTDYGILTYTGHLVDLSIGPTKKQVNIEDIAHHSAYQCRFAGACSRFYSIAEHCIYVAKMAPIIHAPYYLLHDSHETWYQDLTRPLKRLLLASSDVYEKLLTQCDKTVIPALGYSYEGYKSLAADIKKTDLLVYGYERRALFGQYKITFPKDHPLYDMPFGMEPHIAEQIFLEMFQTFQQ